MRTVDLLKAKRRIKGSPSGKYREIKTARGVKKSGGVTVQTSRLRSRGQL
ncbi:hypothetical protein [Sediminicola sp. 1XM1-17]